jgi:hypothetical protein
VVSFTPRPLSGVRSPSTHCIGGWVGPGAEFDVVVERKILCTSWESNSGCPAPSLVTVVSGRLKQLKLGMPGTTQGGDWIHYFDAESTKEWVGA